MIRHRSMWIRCLPPALLFGILAIVTVAQENRRAPTSAARSPPPPDQDGQDARAMA